MTELADPLDFKTAIETILGVTRDPLTNRVVEFGAMGKYTFKNGLVETAFSVGTTPLDVAKVEGIELILPFPDLGLNANIGQEIYSENYYRLTIVCRDIYTLKAYNAFLLLQRSNQLLAFRGTFQDANPKVGSFPQWFCTFRQFTFRDAA